MPFFLGVAGAGAGVTRPLYGSQTTLIEAKLAPTLRGQQRTVIALTQPTPLYGSQVTVMLLRSVALRGQQRTHMVLRGANDPALVFGWPEGSTEVQQAAELANIKVSCEQGQALSMSYEDTGDMQSGQITFPGRGDWSMSTLGLKFEGGGSSFQIDLDVDGDTHASHMDEEGNWTYTVRLYNAAAARVAGQPIGELVSWHRVLRTPNAQGILPRTESVSGIVHRAFAEVGVGFGVVGADPVAGMTWEEGIRDYSTDGKTARAVFDDVYGNLGRLIMRGSMAYLLPYGASEGGAGGVELGPCALTGITETATWAHVPSQIRATAPDKRLLVPIVPNDPNEAAQDPEKDENGVLRPQWVYGYDDELGVYTVGVTAFTAAGVPQANVLVKYGRVVVKWAESGENGETEKEKVFGEVLIEAEKTLYTYHDLNPKMLIEERTTRLKPVYEKDTETEEVSFGIAMYAGRWQASKTLNDEQSVTVQRWYGPKDRWRAGYLQAKSTTERKLLDMKQENPDADPDERGPLEGRNYGITTYSEYYYSPDGEFWTRLYSEGGTGSLPVFDALTGDAIKLVQRSGVAKSGSETGVTPPKVEWPKAPDPAEPPRAKDCEQKAVEVQQPVRTMLAVEKGRGAIQSVSFAMAAGLEELQRLTRAYAAGQGPRTEWVYEMAVASDVRTGQAYAGGIVTRVSLSQSENGEVNSSITAVAQQPATGRFVRHPQPLNLSGVVIRHLDERVGEVMMLAAEGDPVSVVAVFARGGEELPAVGSSVEMTLSSDGYWVQKGEARERCGGDMGSTGGLL